MAFTDTEMAVLAQLAYRDIDAPDEAHVSLYSVLNSNQKSLKAKMGEGFTETIDGLLAKTRNANYTVVRAKNDPYLTGFAAFAVSDPDNHVTVACRGTEGFRDALSDAEIGLVELTDQQWAMNQFLDDLQSEYDFDGYSFTGHSLGGNLAAHGAIYLGKTDPTLVDEVRTFNAPGFNYQYWMENIDSILALGSVIVNYANEYDYVSSIFHLPGDNVIVESNVSSGEIGFDHHSLCAFKIDESGSFQTSGHKGLRTAIPQAVTELWAIGTAGLRSSLNILYLRSKIIQAANAQDFRDFSRSTLENLKNIAKEVEDEAWWDISKWDVWPKMDKFFGGLLMSIDKLAGNVNTYYRKLIDMNDASEKDIQAIFDKVYAIDDNYAAMTRSMTDELQRSVLRPMQELAASVSAGAVTSSDMFLSGTVAIQDIIKPYIFDPLKKLFAVGGVAAVTAALGTVVPIIAPAGRLGWILAGLRTVTEGDMIAKPGGLAAAAAAAVSGVPASTAVAGGVAFGLGAILTNKFKGSTAVTTTTTPVGTVSLGYAEAKISNSANWDIKKGDAGLSSKASVGVGAAKLENKGSSGIASGGYEVDVATVSAESEATLNLMHNGEFNPQIGLGVKAEAKGVSGSLNGQLGSDDFGAHAKVDGVVGKAEAEAKFAVSKDGISGKAEVGAAALSGKGTVGLNIFGLKIDATVKGELGAVGAGAEFGVNDNSFEVGGKLSFLAGLGLKIKVSW